MKKNKWLLLTLKDKSLRQNSYKERSEKKRNVKKEWKRRRNRNLIFKLYLQNQAENLRQEIIFTLYISNLERWKIQSFQFRKKRLFRH